MKTFFFVKSTNIDYVIISIEFIIIDVPKSTTILFRNDTININEVRRPLVRS